MAPIHGYGGIYSTRRDRCLMSENSKHAKFKKLTSVSAHKHGYNINIRLTHQTNLNKELQLRCNKNIFMHVPLLKQLLIELSGYKRVPFKLIELYECARAK